MAIRFYCAGCGQMLSIASRKAGTEITCPKCGARQTVPGEEPGSGALVSTDGAGASGGPGANEGSGDGGQEVGSGPVVVSLAGPPPRPAATAVPAAGPRVPTPPAPGTPLPPGMVLLSRRAIYVQGLLFAVVGVMAFCAGYVVGRGRGAFEPRPAEEPSVRRPVLLEGTLVYEPADGTPVADEGAVVIALPETATPESPLPVRGIRPIDPEMTDTEATIQQIEACGGAFVRAGAQGTFSLVVPRPGRYRVLAISAHVQRAEDVRIDELDLQELGEWLDRPAYLIGDFKYRWTIVDIRAGAPPWEHDFGPSGGA